MTATHTLVVGSANTDLVIKTPRLPEPGETVLGGQFVIAPGGKGANQAVAAARLGAEVALLACVGADRFGDDLLEAIRGSGVHCDQVVRCEAAHSGIGLIMVGPDGENMIAVASGSNQHLRPEHLDAVPDAFEAAAVVLTQLEIPEATVCRVGELSAAHGARLVLNAAPAVPMSPSLLPRVQIAIPNRLELGFHTGHPTDSLDNVGAASRCLLGRGVGAVVTTLGRDGALVVTDDGTEHLHAPVVDAVDATAAGDAFCGALAVALGEGCDLVDATRFAVAAASLSVTRMGAQPSLPTRAETEAFRARVAA